MRSYKFLPHTADVRILAQGSSIAELFCASLEALCQVLVPSDSFDRNNASLSLIIEIESTDTTTLLIDFLSAALTRMYLNNALLPFATFELLTDTSVKAVISGFEALDFQEDVKAVTYHEAEVTKVGNSYKTTIVIDI